MSQLFGTDSAKGAIPAAVSAELAMQAGQAAAVFFSGKKDKQTTILIGKDTALSSDMTEAAIAAGISSAGGKAVLMGTKPYPALCHLVRTHEADAGIMVSKAHNAANSSGMRLIGADGRPVTADRIEQIEQLVYGNIRSAESGSIGEIVRGEESISEYTSYIASIASADLSGMRVALSCSDKSCIAPAQTLLTEAGADVVLMPEQSETQDSGIDLAATALEQLMEFTVSSAADCGLAIGEDGGSCLAADENGHLVDGDVLLAIFAKSMKERGRLNNNTAAASPFSSFSLTRFARDNGISIVTTGANSRYILERMIEDNCSLGGEKSGHIIFLDDMPTGDGLLCGMRLLKIMKETGKPLSVLAVEIQKLPQVIVNVPIGRRFLEIWKNDSSITSLISRYSDELGSEGRILVREGGGQEPAIRVIIEGRNFGTINEMAMRVSEQIRLKCPRKSR